MRILVLTILTILGFIWAIISGFLLFAAGLGGEHGSLFLQLTLMLPGYLGFITYNIFNQLLNLKGGWGIFGIVFSVFYGVSILLLLNGLLEKLRNKS